MNSLKAQYRTRFALIVMVMLVVLAGCDSTGIPSVGTPVAAATSTPKAVASAPTDTPQGVEPTPTLEEFFPIETPTNDPGGSGRLSTATPQSLATATPILQIADTETPILQIGATATRAEPTGEATALPT